MRVFVVGTGRCGTRTFAQACKRITNYTTAHESHSRRLIGNLDYPDGHIESDHHLAWSLPLLLDRYPSGPGALYVHLLRERAACVASLSRRHDMDLWAMIGSFVACGAKTPDLRRQAAAHYYDAKNALIAAALRGCPNVMTVYVESLPAAWPEFWSRIGAQGDYQGALAECAKRYNRGLECKGQPVRCEP